MPEEAVLDSPSKSTDVTREAPDGVTPGGPTVVSPTAMPTQQKVFADEKAAHEKMADAYDKFVKEAPSPTHPLITEPGKPAEAKKEARSSSSGKVEDERKSSPQGTDASALPDANSSAEEQSTDGGKAPGEPVGAEALDKAKRALKRGNFPDEVIEGLTDHRIAELGGTVAKRQADQDRLQNNYSELQGVVRTIMAEREAEDQKQPAQKQLSQDSAPVAEPVAPPVSASATLGDLNQELKSAIAESLGSLKEDDLYGDMADNLGEALTGTAERIASYHQAQLDQVRQRADEQRQQDQQAFLSMFDKMNLKEAFRGNRRNFPELSDSEQYRKAESRAYTLANLEGYQDGSGEPDWDRIASDAVHLEFGKNNQRRAQMQLANTYDDQANGQPEPIRERGEVPGSAMTNDEAMAYAHQKIHDEGADPEEVRRHLTKAMAG